MLRKGYGTSLELQVPDSQGAVAAELAAFRRLFRCSQPAVLGGVLDRASPNFMGLASLGLEIDIFCDSLHGVLLLKVILWLDFLGPALSLPQVLGQLAEYLDLAQYMRWV